MENITPARALALPVAPSLDVDAVIAQMRTAGRVNLIHYAGAAHRDIVAWHLCWAYSADPAARERNLKAIALKLAWGVDVDPAQITETPYIVETPWVRS